MSCEKDHLISGLYIEAARKSWIDMRAMALGGTLSFSRSDSLVTWKISSTLAQAVSNSPPTHVNAHADSQFALAIVPSVCKHVLMREVTISDRG